MNIKVEDLSMDFDDAGKVVRVFENLSFEIQSGQTAAIVGESGVGKTTLLYLLGALEKPRAGKITLGNTCITDNQLSRHQRSEFRGANIGFVFQFHQLLPEFDAVENVAMPLFIQGLDKKEAKKRAELMLEKVNLSHRLDHRPGQLSGGEQQRVAIARALVSNPGLVLADEPTGNLDSNTAENVGNLLIELNRQEKRTLVIVTHSIELASRMDKVFRLTAKGITLE
jgi:lipoprotein-releasing system ATP-binding protein